MAVAAYNITTYYNTPVVGTIPYTINTTYHSDATLVGLNATACMIAYNTNQDTNGYTFANSGKEFIEVVCEAKALTVTVAATIACDHGFDHDIVATSTGGVENLKLGPFPVKWFGNLVSFKISGGATASTKLGVFQLPATSPLPE